MNMRKLTAGLVLGSAVAGMVAGSAYAESSDKISISVIAAQYGQQTANWWKGFEKDFEKDNPNIFDYNIPQELRDIYAAKDFGRWVNENGEVPVCFIATNHTTGGNSGSPVINADGDLIGINFDRVWEGTMSDIDFDPDFCRNISLDVRYVLFIIEKIGKASYLFDEMTFTE